MLVTTSSSSGLPAAAISLLRAFIFPKYSVMVIDPFFVVVNVRRTFIERARTPCLHRTPRLSRRFCDGNLREDVLCVGHKEEAKDLLIPGKPLFIGWVGHLDELAVGALLFYLSLWTTGLAGDMAF